MLQTRRCTLCQQEFTEEGFHLMCPRCRKIVQREKERIAKGYCKLECTSRWFSLGLVAASMSDGWAISQEDLFKTGEVAYVNGVLHWWCPDCQHYVLFGIIHYHPTDNTSRTKDSDNNAGY